MNQDSIISTFDFFSFLTSVVSLVLALVTMWLANRAETAVKTQAEESKKTLHEVDKRAAVIEALVKDAQEKLLTTVTNIANMQAQTNREESHRRLENEIAHLVVPSRKHDASTTQQGDAPDGR